SSAQHSAAALAPLARHAPAPAAAPRPLARAALPVADAAQSAPTPIRRRPTCQSRTPASDTIAALAAALPSKPCAPQLRRRLMFEASAAKLGSPTPPRRHRVW